MVKKNNKGVGDERRRMGIRREVGEVFDEGWEGGGEAL